MPLRDMRVKINPEERLALSRIIRMFVDSLRAFRENGDTTVNYDRTEKDIAIVQGLQRKMTNRKAF